MFSRKVKLPYVGSRSFWAALAISLCLVFMEENFSVQGAIAQETDEGKEEKEENKEDCEGDDCEKPKSKKTKIKSIEEFTKDKERKDGLFAFYIDPENGDTYMEITIEQLNKNFIYFNYAQNGTSNRAFPGLGEIRENAVISLRRHFNRVDFFRENTDYTFDPDNALARKPENNNISPLIMTAKIVAENKDKSVFIIDAGKMFKGNGFIQLGGKKNGTLSKDKSSILRVQSYPDNVNIISEYIFDNAKAKTVAGSSLTVTLQHSFLTMPDDGFAPRRDDPRIGFFTQRKTNLTRLEGLPFDDVIKRWRLSKKNPDLPLSDVIKPITYWIENTTPHEYRNLITQAVLAWNPAFEKAGFKNAIEVKIQPDDATWDAGDIHYNVIRWISSPSPRFLGYGPSFANPLTGEILGADIVLEQANIKRAIMYDEVFSLSMKEGEMSGYELFQDGCTLAHGMQFERNFAQLSSVASDQDQNKIIAQGLYYVVLHEVGHTLGLTHNMMGSYYRTLGDLNNKGQNLVNSIMDYPAVNIAPKGEKQGLYFPNEPGPYDEWAIVFGYDSRLENTTLRKKHLARSSAPDLRFGNDADSMARTNLGIDPRVNVFDLSSDPIGFAIAQSQLANETLSTLRDDLAKEGQSWDNIYRATRVLLNFRKRSATTISRYIAGVYVDRAFVDQPTDSGAPLVPVEYKTKKRAMTALNKYLFSPNAFVFSEELIQVLQQQRRGFDFAKGLTRQDPLVHAWVRSIQEEILSYLLNHRVLRRLTDSGLYGNEYSANEMLRDLTDHIFKADLKHEVNSFRRNLQVAYVKQAIEVFKSSHLDAISESELLAVIYSVKKMMKSHERRGSEGTRAHRSYIRYLIKEGLDE